MGDTNRPIERLEKRNSAVQTELVAVLLPTLYFVFGILQRRRYIHVRAFVPKASAEQADIRSIITYHFSSASNIIRQRRFGSHGGIPPYLLAILAIKRLLHNPEFQGIPSIPARPVPPALPRSRSAPPRIRSFSFRPHFHLLRLFFSTILSGLFCRIQAIYTDL